MKCDNDTNNNRPKCLVELKKEQLDKNRKIIVLKNSLKTCFIALF